MTCALVASMAVAAKTVRRSRRVSEARSRDNQEPVSAVRLLEARKGNRSVVELSSPKADNPLYRAFRALRDLGVQIVHAEVRAMSDQMIQRLYLMENDGSSLEPSRLSEVLVALGRARHLGLAERLEGPTPLVA